MIKIEKPAIKTIEDNPVAFATVTTNNTPNVIGVAYVKVIDNKIVITDNFMEKTIENLKSNNNVSLVVWNKDWEGYKISGTAEYFTNGSWADLVKNMKENEGLPAKGAVLITPLSIMAVS